MVCGYITGMSEKHMQTEKYSVSEYANAQRRLHKQILREQQKAAGIAGKRNTRQVGNGDFMAFIEFALSRSSLHSLKN